MLQAAGTRLGPYEILAPIGAGGMGEVYRARDARLGRDVAIKVLPVRFNADPDRLARFEREARAAAALNHPNILTVYDIGHDAAAPYIVAELLEGDSLADRIEKGPLPIRKVIDYAAQIARGLSAAHERGVVHRDLKPANLFVTDDGRVKNSGFRSRETHRTGRGGRRAERRDTIARNVAGHRARHARLHVARAGTRARGRPSVRHLCFRRDRLRTAVGAPRVRGRNDRRHDSGDPEQAPDRALALWSTPGPSRADADRRSVPGKESGRALSVDRRFGVRARSPRDAFESARRTAAVVRAETAKPRGVDARRRSGARWRRDHGCPLGPVTPNRIADAAPVADTPRRLESGGLEQSRSAHVGRRFTRRAARGAGRAASGRPYHHSDPRARFAVGPVRWPAPRERRRSSGRRTAGSSASLPTAR